MRRKKLGKVEEISKVWLSKDEACAYLGVTQRFLQRLRDEALIPFYKFGSKMLWYKKSDLDDFIKSKKII